MLSINWKLAAALSLVCAIALSATAAEAQNARKKPVNRSVAASTQSASAYYAAPVRSSGMSFSDSRMGANYNPNQ
jgi:hypothetical protein